MLNYLKKSKEILGRNERDLKYVKVPLFKMKYHTPSNKLRTKKVLRKAGIPVPKTYKIIRNKKELHACKWNKLPNSFVVKPNIGTLGRGILIVFGKTKTSEEPWKNWAQANKQKITVSDLKNHILRIFNGNYSLGRVSDIAFFEERLKIHPTLKHYCSRGIPDVRVMVYNKIPVMAELRLPTLESQGRANLRQGGIGIGINMSAGTTTAQGVWQKKLIDRLPGKKKLPLANIEIPFWERILELAVETQIALGIDYLGLDVAIDREKGPIVVEANTRPGLGIQIANLSPLKPRLEIAKRIKFKSVERAVMLGMNLF